MSGAVLGPLQSSLYTSYLSQTTLAKLSNDGRKEAKVHVSTP